MIKTFIFKAGFDNQVFFNGVGEPYKNYCFELIDTHGIKITETIRIHNYLTNEQAQNKINKHLNKIMKSYLETKNQNLHLYK